MRTAYVKIAACFGFILAGLVARSQTTVIRDKEIDLMVHEVNADSLQAHVRSMVSFVTRNTMSAQNDKKKGIGAARNWVLGKFNVYAKRSNGRMSAVIDTSLYKSDGRRVNRNVIVGNVVATLKGTDPSDKRIFLITGHLDNRRTEVMDSIKEAPGANDDASGCAAVVECARILSAHSFPATIVFVTVSGEEQGLLGAGALAAKAKKANWDIEGILNNDIMGSNNSSETRNIDNTRIRVFSEGLPAFETEKSAKQIRQLGLENDGKARQLARYVKEIGERYVDNIEVVMIYRNDRFLRGGDHLPFVENGFAAVRITEMNENFDHQHQDVRKENGTQFGDLLEFMDFEYLRKNTGINLATLANLAKAPSPPEEVKIETKNLTNYSHLTWRVPKNGSPRAILCWYAKRRVHFGKKRFLQQQRRSIFPIRRTITSLRSKARMATKVLLLCRRRDDNTATCSVTRQGESERGRHSRGSIVVPGELYFFVNKVIVRQNYFYLPAISFN